MKEEWPKEAKECMKERYGYIIRRDDSGNTLQGFYGGFEPSAIEQKKIDQIVSA